MKRAIFPRLRNCCQPITSFRGELLSLQLRSRHYFRFFTFFKRFGNFYFAGFSDDKDTSNYHHGRREGIPGWILCACSNTVTEDPEDPKAIIRVIVGHVESKTVGLHNTNPCFDYCNKVVKEQFFFI